MKNPNTRDIQPPVDLPGLIEFIVLRSPGYKASKPYQIDLDGDYTANPDVGILAASSYARYILDQMSRYVRFPAESIPRRQLESALRGDFEVLEILCHSQKDDILTAINTGIFEGLSDAEGDCMAAIVANLGPRTRSVWEDYMPWFTGNRFKANRDFKFMEWAYR